MIDRSRMPVLLDCALAYKAANQAFRAIGLERHQYRELRKKLRRWGAILVQVGRREHIIERTL